MTRDDYIAEIRILREALEKAFNHSCDRAEGRTKWTDKDQQVHEALKAALVRHGEIHRVHTVA